MTSSQWSNVVLVVVVLAPLASAVLASAAAAPAEDRRWTTGGVASAVVGLALLLVTGQHPHVARLAPDDVALAAGTAVALVALAARPLARSPQLAVAVTIAVCGVAVGSPGRPSTGAPALAIAAALAVVAIDRDNRCAPLACAAVGALVAAAGIHQGGHGGTAAVTIGAVVAVVGAGVRVRAASVVVVPVALALVLRVGGSLEGTSTSRWVAVACATVAAAVAVGPVIVRSRPVAPPAIALAGWACAAAVAPLPDIAPAARLLAAAAVLALTLGGPAAALAGLPGAATVAVALAEGQGWTRLALAGLAVSTVAGLVFAPFDVTHTPRRHASMLDGVMLTLVGWLVLRPTSWTWARPLGLDAYTDGATLGLASALVTGVALVLMRPGGTLTEPLLPWFVAPGRDQRPTPGSAATGVFVAVVLMGVTTAALVRSARL